MIWYHGTSLENWEKIQAEGILWGISAGRSRVTWLATKSRYCKPRNDVILRVKYDPVGRLDENGPLNNYSPDSWQIRVYEPIPLSAVEQYDEKLEKMLKNANPETDVPSSDPVHFHEGKWWFWDEVWVDRMGPFETKEEARAEILRYCKEVLGHETNIKLA